MSKRRHSPLCSCVLGLLLIPVLAACTAVEARDDHRYTVQMTSNERYMPATLRVSLGDTVVWHNTSLEPHTSTAGAPGEDAATPGLPVGATPWNSGTLNPGDMWSRTFDVPGTYIYHCRFHEAEGMVGTITVNA